VEAAAVVGTICARAGVAELEGGSWEGMGGEDAVAQGFVVGVEATPGRTNGGEYNTPRCKQANGTPSLPFLVRAQRQSPLLYFNGIFFCAS